MNIDHAKRKLGNFLYSIEWACIPSHEQMEISCSGFSEWAVAVYGGSAVTAPSTPGSTILTTTISPADEYFARVVAMARAGAFAGEENMERAILTWVVGDLSDEAEEPEGIVRVPRGFRTRPEFVLSRQAEDRLLAIVNRYFEN